VELENWSSGVSFASRRAKNWRGGFSLLLIIFETLVSSPWLYEDQNTAGVQGPSLARLDRQGIRVMSHLARSVR
jgi:hypothetical protein